MFVQHLHMRVSVDGTITAAALPEDAMGSPTPVSNLSADVMIDIISSIRAAIFFAVQELKVGCVCMYVCVCVYVCACACIFVYACLPHAF